MEDFKPGCPSDDAFTDFPCQVTSAVTEFSVTDGTRVFFNTSPKSDGHMNLQ